MIFEVYKDRAGEWRWRMKATNGLIIGDSGQGYANKSELLDMVDKIRVGARDATVVDLEENNGN